MTISQFESLDDAYRWVIESILSDGQAVAPRSINTTELRGVHISIENPRKRYVSLLERHWSFAYALGEFCWHARGSSRVDEIAFYSNRWREMSEDGITIRGSNYGAKIFGSDGRHESQWSVVNRTLKLDPGSRRGVLYFVDALNDATARSRDVSCATSLQFFVRHGRLEAVATMRSNDAMLGLPYDIFLFTMLQELMACTLNLELGRYHHFAGSLHIYDGDLSAARAIAGARPTVLDPMPAMSSVDRLAHFVQGEQQARTGLPIAYDDFKESRYWADLLSVLEYRNGARLGRLHDIEQIIKNPVYRQLTKLRSS